MNAKFAGVLLLVMSFRAFYGYFNSNKSSQTSSHAGLYESLPYQSSSIGTTNWMKPEKASCDDLEGTYINIFHDSSSSFLQATNWNFTIPQDAVITDIVFRFSGKTYALFVQDAFVALLKSSTPVVETSPTQENWPVGNRFYREYPLQGEDPLWGTYWTPQDINSPNFGVQIRLMTSSPVDTIMQAYIYCMELTVTYALRGNSSKIIEDTHPFSASSGSQSSQIDNTADNNSRRSVAFSVMIVSGVMILGVLSTMCGVLSLMAYRMKLKQEEKLQTIELLTK